MSDKDKRIFGLIDLVATIGGSTAFGLYTNSWLVGVGTFLLVHALRQVQR